MVLAVLLAIGAEPAPAGQCCRGFPFTIEAPTSQFPAYGSGLILNQRADLINPAAATLASDFERLWLKTPIGLFSLADAEAGGPAFSQEARLPASLYAVRANRRLDLSILVRVLGFWLVKRISFGNRL